MATRFYLNTYGWAPVRPTPNAGWETTRALESGHSRRIMYPWRSSGPDIGPSAVEVQNAVHDILMAQYISEPLAAQTISGTIRAVIQAGENNASANWRSQMHAWVMAPDGSSRGTLTTFNTGGLSNEWTASTSTLRSAFFPVGSTGTTVTNVNALAGDRIVVEVGARSHDTSATTFSGRIRLGDGHFSSPGTNWDLPSNQTDTSTTRNGWIEFSANLTFQTAETAITDNIADAVDAMPAAEGHVIARVADISTFTAEADDPTDIGNYNNSGDTGFSGWIKLVGPVGGARVKIQPTCGLALDVMGFVFDGVPDSSSVAEQVYPDPATFGDPIPLFVDVPFGTTKYVCVQPMNGSFETFSIGDKNIQVILSRGRAGGMSDTIADAPDVLPAVQDTSVSAFQTDYDFFSSEADDPQWISDEYFGAPLNFTAWVKLVVPSSGIKVNIDTYLPIDYIEGPTGTYLFVFDGVPDSSSVPIAVGDNNTDSSPPAGSIDQNWFFKAKITDLSLESGHTYYICAMTWDGPFWEHWEEGTNLQITVYRHLDGGLTTEDDFGVDAIVRKVMADPIYLGTPTYVDSTSAAVDTGSTITLAAPTGLQQGDVMVAVINAATPSVSLNSMTSAGWTSLGSPSFATSPINHLLYSFYRFVDDDPSTSWVFSHQIGSTPVSSAKAGAVVAFRDAGVPILRTSNGTTTVSTGNKVTPSWFVLSDDPNYLSPITVLLAWAGGSTGTTTWTPGTGVTEREDVSATSLASLMVGTGNDALDNFIDSRFATPSQAEHNQTLVIQITGRTAVFGISALLLPGFPINAYIQAATHTTHPRTGPHTGTHLDTAIVTSATLGSLPAGTDLHTVLMDLDAMLTDLENQS